MAQETNINAYKAELATAEVALDRAKSRVEELKSYIESVEPTPKKKAEEVPVVEPIDEGEKVEVKVVPKPKSKRG